MKLTDAQVAEIRRRRLAGELVKNLAVDFGVRESCISRIINFVRRANAA